jgi:hypothetical protein
MAVAAAALAAAKAADGRCRLTAVRWLQVNYKNVMKQYGLGPNGGILTSCNLFATRFDQVGCGRSTTCIMCMQLVISQWHQRLEPKQPPRPRAAGAGQQQHQQQPSSALAVSVACCGNQTAAYSTTFKKQCMWQCSL